MGSNAIYQATAGARPGKTAFDRSSLHITDVNIGALVPVWIEEVIPGDVYDLSAVSLIRSQPLVTPIFHKLQVFFHTFFVPWRIVFRDWEKFISRGSSGDEIVSLPKFAAAQYNNNAVRVDRYSLYDYFGLPIHDPATGAPADDYSFVNAPPMHDLYWRAYWAIWRDFYRDANHQLNYPDILKDLAAPVPCGESPDELLDQLDVWMETEYDSTADIPCNQVAYRCWEKDYFTSALPWQQRGTAPAIPVSGTSAAIWPSASFTNGAPDRPFGFKDLPDGDAYTQSAGSLTNAIGWFNSNSVTFAAAGISVSSMRATIQTQRWMERNARGGYRYNEFLQAHFGVNPKDERLQRPEYIGGSRNPVIISEVLQTSATDVAVSPQGNMAGHAMAVNDSFQGRYRVLEHGCLMTIMSIMPEAVYQSGVARTFLRDSTFDFYSPEFAHLSEQEIQNQEIFFGDTGGMPGLDTVRFGFQAAWDEYRDKPSIVTGKMANGLDIWHLSRQFDGLPSLNEDFLTLQNFSETRRDSWAVPGVVSNSQGQFLVQYRAIVKAVRPMPYISDPGQMDHF